MVFLNSDSEEHLFSTMSCLVQFVVIEEEFKQIFDLCLNLQESTEEKLNNVLNEINEIENGKNWYKSIEDGDIHKDEILMGLVDFVVPNLQSTLNFYVPANQLILLNIFLEKSLKMLCFEYSHKNDSKVFGGHKEEIKLLKGKSKIVTYINFIEKSLNLKLSIENKINLIDGNLRKIRNSFAHGDWEDVEEILKNIDLNEYLISISDVFKEIENVIMKKETCG